MTTKSAIANFSLSLAELGAAVLGQNSDWKGSVGAGINFGHGTTLGNFDLLYCAERTLADGGTDSIDLSGVLTSPLGEAFVGVEIAFVAIINIQKDGTANTTNLTVGAGSNKVVGLFDSLVLRPGAFACAGGPSAGGVAAITAATSDILQIVNSAGAINKYQLAVLGRSA